MKTHSHSYPHVERFFYAFPSVQPSAADNVARVSPHLSLVFTPSKNIPLSLYGCFTGFTDSRIVVTGMKYRIANRPVPCKQRPPDHIMPQYGTTPFGNAVWEYIYPCGTVMLSLSPLALCSLSLLSLAWRGADANRVRVGSVVVVAVAVVVDIAGRDRRASISTGAKKPPKHRRNNLQSITDAGITLRNYAFLNRFFEDLPRDDPLFPSAH